MPSSVAVNHPAYFEVAEVFIRGRRDVAFVIWRSPIGMILEDLVCNLQAFVTALTMGEIFEWLLKLARVCYVTDGSDWTEDQAFESQRRPPTRRRSARGLNR